MASDPDTSDPDALAKFSDGTGRLALSPVPFPVGGG